jgi:hypothetical protein
LGPNPEPMNTDQKHGWKVTLIRNANPDWHDVSDAIAAQGPPVFMGSGFAAVQRPGMTEGMAQTLFTIGYEKARLADVVAALKEADVKTLIDVRDRPQSRRPGFSKRQLAAGLEEAGIRYVGLKALGTPPEGREANRKRQWERFWRIVDDKLATAEAEHALEEAAAMAAESPSCLLCYEADWHICHRARVADILVGRHGFTIHHLAPLVADA